MGKSQFFPSFGRIDAVGRVCAGILGPLAVVGVVAHGLLHGAAVDEILVRSWLGLIGFAIIGAIVGVIGERALKESIEFRLKEELSRRTRSSQSLGSV